MNTGQALLLIGAAFFVGRGWQWFRDARGAMNAWRPERKRR